MKIISTNIGEAVSIEWRGQEIQTGIFKYSTNDTIFLNHEDVDKDHVLDRRYHGGLDKACYLYSSDHYTFWQSKYPELDWKWGMFGENLTVEGLEESTILIGDKYRIGEAIVQVSQPRQPCFKLGIRFGNQSAVEDFWNSAFPGVYVRVLQPGNVSAGDKLYLTERVTDSLSIAEVFSIFTMNRNNFSIIQKALNDSHLASSCRRDIQKIFDNQ
jgi:MOSC domain-containing protein YiiM